MTHLVIWAITITWSPMSYTSVNFHTFDISYTNTGSILTKLGKKGPLGKSVWQVHSPSNMAAVTNNKNIYLRHVFWNKWTNDSQTRLEGSFVGPFWKLCPTVSPSIEMKYAIYAWFNHIFRQVKSYHLKYIYSNFD